MTHQTTDEHLDIVMVSETEGSSTSRATVEEKVPDSEPGKPNTDDYTVMEVRVEQPSETLQQAEQSCEQLGERFEPVQKYPKDPTQFPPGRIDDAARTLLCYSGPYQPIESDISPNFHFPVTGGRCFQTAWYTRQLSHGSVEREWLEYSPSTDAMFCFSCRVFGKTNSMFYEYNWTRNGVRNWKKALEKIYKHEESNVHLNAIVDWKQFVDKAGIETGMSKWAELAFKKRVKKIEENKAILGRLLDIILFLACQNLPLRGHDERKDSHNRGNFLELVTLLQKYDPVLAKHMETSKAKELYCSPDIQNDCIKALGQAVEESIIKKLKEAGCFSLIVDETTDSGHKEQVSITLRFALNGEIHESFMCFKEVSNTRADTLSNLLLDFLQDKGLSITHVRGQAYDGASNMSGQYSGVKTRILQRNPRAFYVHCCNHRLNLVLSNSAQCTLETKIFF